MFSSFKVAFEGGLPFLTQPLKSKKTKSTLDWGGGGDGGVKLGRRGFWIWEGWTEGRGGDRNQNILTKFPKS